MAKRPAAAAHVHKRQRTRHKEASSIGEEKLLLSFDCRHWAAVDPSLEPEELVARLLAPLSREEFLKHCWAEKAVAVHGHPRRLAPIISRLSDLDLEAMLQESPSDMVHAWLRDGQDATRGAASSALRSVAVDSAAALGLRAAKAALYFRANEDLETLLVSQICSGLGAGAAGMYPGDGRPRGEIETFVASEGHVTGWHTDFQHNFTFQLRGAKRWRFKAGPVKNNVRALTPHFQTRSNFEQQMKLHLLSDPTEPDFRPPDDFFADAEEVELHAGSVLYHPAGIWHHVECLGEESISINVSLSIATWADLVGDAVRQLLWASPSLRQPLVGLDCMDPSHVRQTVGQKLKEAKRDFNKLTAEDLLPTAMLESPRLPSRIHLSKSVLGKDLHVAQEQSFRFGLLASLVELPEADSDSDEEDLPKNARRYALHINFGNEDVGSWIRVVLVAPSLALRTAMAWLGKRQLAARAGACKVCFKAKELVQASDMSWAQTTRLIRVLRYCGYIYLEK